MTALATDESRPWTIDQVLELPADRLHRHELIDGSVLVSPAPGLPHQLAASLLWQALYVAAPAELGAYEAINVQAGPARLLIPDVVVVKGRRKRATVVPASEVVLVAEIVSPSSRAIDRIFKPALYAEVGVPFYLRAELDDPVLVMHELADGVYREVATAKSGEELRLDEPFSVVIDPDSLLG